MKQILPLALLLMCFTAVAQHHDPRPQYAHHPDHNGSATLVVSATHGERFTVYVDGDLVNRYPQQQVVVNHLDYSNHDIYVVLTSPQDKINMLVFCPVSPREECRVHFDPRSNQLELILPQPMGQPPYASNPFEQPVMHQPEVHTLVHCSDQEVEQMVELLKSQSFDSSREKLALNFAENHRLLASQILRLAQEFTFNSSRKDFLKQAYAFCVDPENYALVVSCLTFTSDREEVLDFISR